MDDPTREPDPTWILLAGRYAARRHPGLEPRVLLRVLRRGARLSQKEVAGCAGLQRTRVSEIESGRVEPRWGEVRGLLKAMGCEPVLLAAGAGYAALRRPLDWDA